MSWQAVLGGAVVALAAEILIGVVGFGIMSALHGPRADAVAAVELPALGPGVGLAGAWLGLLAGGVVAGRLAGAGRRARGALHGAAVWGFATVAAVQLLSSSGGFFFARGLGVDVARPGRAVAWLGGGDDAAWTAVRGQARALLAAHAHPLPAGYLAAPKLAAAPAGPGEVGAEAGRAWRILRDPLKRLVVGDVSLGADLDRRLVVDVLVGHAGLTVPQADVVVARWTTGTSARGDRTSGRHAGPLRVLVLLAAGFLAASVGGWLGTRARACQPATTR